MYCGNNDHGTLSSSLNMQCTYTYIHDGHSESLGFGLVGLQKKMMAGTKLAMLLWGPDVISYSSLHWKWVR